MELAKTKDIDGQIFERLVICGVERLKEQVGVINDLNVFPIPDGDTGDNMLSTISGGLTAMKKVRENSIGIVRVWPQRGWHPGIPKGRNPWPASAPPKPVPY